MSNGSDSISKAEALQSLEHAAEVANDSLSDAISKCTTEAEKDKIIHDKNAVDAAYLKAQFKSIQDTSARVKALSDNLKSEADAVKAKSKQLSNAVEAINLFTELVKLATALALVFA